jgi:hypothetical protein
LGGTDEEAQGLGYHHELQVQTGRIRARDKYIIEWS